MSQPITFLCVPGSTQIRLSIPSVKATIAAPQVSLYPTSGDLRMRRVPDIQVTRDELRLRCENGLMKMEPGRDIELVSDEEAPAQAVPDNT
ncbi:hypothetical protein GCM10025871_04700 [Deinococcus metallilatus]|nr:hypothetical protein GCM10025871_04700 [Deinococcus metallilatus]